MLDKVNYSYKYLTKFNCLYEYLTKFNCLYEYLTKSATATNIRCLHFRRWPFTPTNRSVPQAQAFSAFTSFTPLLSHHLSIVGHSVFTFRFLFVAACFRFHRFAGSLKLQLKPQATLHGSHARKHAPTHHRNNGRPIKS